MYKVGNQNVSFRVFIFPHSYTVVVAAAVVAASYYRMCAEENHFAGAFFLFKKYTQLN